MSKKVSSQIYWTKSLFLSALILTWACAFGQEVTTFYVKAVGDKKMGERLLERLQEKSCHQFLDSCHRFERYQSDSQIKGDFSAKGSSLLYQVKITHQKGVDRFNLQIFQREGKALRRVRNAGNFTPQEFKIYKDRKISREEFLNELVEKTVGISFK